MPLIADASPLWFATRGAGTVTLILLTVSVVLGVVCSVGWRSPLWPRFLTQSLHRNITLLTLVLLALHIATSVLDPFAHLRWRDAVVPFGAPYRPFWLGLGVVAMEILVALVVSSLARDRIGHRLWRLIHWIAYASWPVAVLHGLGTGSDARATWSIGITATCVATVLAGVGWRLAAGWPERPMLRLSLASGSLMGIALLYSWASAGPLHPGWADRAGTPVPVGPAAQQVSTPATYAHDVQGSLVKQGAASRIVLTAVDDATLDIVITSPSAPGAAPSLTVTHGPRTVCTAAATVGATVEATCGASHVSIGLSGAPASLTGRLTSTGPLS